MKKLLLSIVAMLAVICRSDARETLNFDKGWRFALADSTQMSQRDFDDSTWRLLNVPHDWAIEGDFSA